MHMHRHEKTNKYWYNTRSTSYTQRDVSSDMPRAPDTVTSHVGGGMRPHLVQLADLHVTSVSIPDSITTISACAFPDCRLSPRSYLCMAQQKWRERSINNWV